MMGYLVMTDGRGVQPARTLDWTQQPKGRRRKLVTVDCIGLLKSRRFGPSPDARCMAVTACGYTVWKRLVHGFTSNALGCAMDNKKGAEGALG